ncbi:MAG: transketolase-like TK C-terminal-containing protein [Candidatus Actinomarina sp.]
MQSNQAQKVTNKPSLIIAKSTIGKYSPNKANTSGVHGSPLGKEEFELFLENIGHSGDPFVHSSEIYDYFNKERERDNKKYEEWKANLDKRLSNDDNFKIMWNKFNNIDFQPVSLEWSDDQASRVIGGKILNEMGKSNKFIIGGSADLAASTKQIVSNEVFGPENYGGNSLEFGIREHAMGGIVNGIALHSNLVPYGSTFLVFSDYMRPSIRLASLMGTNSVFIFTHDSIFLGEDGPTHQPVEHLMALRLIPGLDVIRPANNNEILHAYRSAFENKNKPSAIVLSRQDMKYLEKNIKYDEFIRGAYEYSPGKDITIFASGSELEIAVEVSNLLDDLSIQVISVPMLNKLNNETLNSLNPNSEIFTIELGRSVGWDSYIKNIKKSFSIDSFGKSAPIVDLKNEFDFAAENIAKEIKNLIN